MGAGAGGFPSSPVFLASWLHSALGSRVAILIATCAAALASTAHVGPELLATGFGRRHHDQRFAEVPHTPLPCLSLMAVAGLDRYPRKITKAMGAKKVAKRSLMKPFIKHVNFTHMMPTRYQVPPSPSLCARSHALCFERKGGGRWTLRIVPVMLQPCRGTWCAQAL